MFTNEKDPEKVKESELSGPPSNILFMVLYKLSYLHLHDSTMSGSNEMLIMFKCL